MLDRERVLSPSAEAAAPAAPSEASPRTPESELVLEADSLLVGLAHLAVLAAKETRGQRRASIPEARLNSQERARGCRISAQGAEHWRRRGERQLERTEAHGQHERPARDYSVHRVRHRRRYPQFAARRSARALRAPPPAQQGR